MGNFIKKLLAVGIILIVIGIILYIITNYIYCLIFVYIGLAIGGGCTYFLPTILAYDKKHKDKANILLINFLLGWTLIGWLACIIWVSINREDNKKNINNKYEDLEKLQKLKEDGIITEVEFEIEKTKLLR